MSSTDDNFKSQMMKALYGLQAVQFSLLRAEVNSLPPGQAIQQAWALLWANLRACSTLATVIRTSTLGDEGSTAGAESRLQGIATSPLVSPESPQFGLLTVSIERSMRSTAQMRRHAAIAYEALIQEGQADSDCGHAVNLCRLYGDTLEALFESIAKELHLPPAMMTAQGAPN